jgi:hypothetical protein
MTTLSITILSILTWTLSIITFSKVLYVLSVPKKPFLVGVIMLNDVMLGVIMLSVAPITYRNDYSN